MGGRRRTRIRSGIVKITRPRAEGVQVTGDARPGRNQLRSVGQPQRTGQWGGHGSIALADPVTKRVGLRPAKGRRAGRRRNMKRGAEPQTHPAGRDTPAPPRRRVGQPRRTRPGLDLTPTLHTKQRNTNKKAQGAILSRPQGSPYPASHASRRLRWRA